MRRYGLVAGNKVYAYSESINKGLDGTIEGQWTDMEALQTQVISTKGATVKNLEKILILDQAILGAENMNTQDEEYIDKKVNEFIFIQNLFKNKEYHGVHLVLLTRNNALYQKLSNYFKNNRIDKYDGTQVMYSVDDSYAVAGIAKVLEQKLDPLGNVKGVSDSYIKEQQQRQKNVIEENRRIQRVLGARDELLKQKDEIDKKLNYISKQLEKYIMKREEQTLDTMDDELEGSTIDEIKETLKE